MRFLVPFLCLLLLAATPIKTDYGSKDNIKAEFLNSYMKLQDKQFYLLTSTPALTDIREGEFVIFYAGQVKLITKINGLFYSVDLSSMQIK